MIDTELAKYGPTGVAIGALVLVWLLVRLFVNKVTSTMDANTKATIEMTTYLKLRNGTGDKVLTQVTETLEKVHAHDQQVVEALERSAKRERDYKARRAAA